MLRSGTRRDFIRNLGLSAAAAPFLGNLPSLAFANSRRRKQRLVVIFSPNGIVPTAFWPDEEGELKGFKEILAPLEPFRRHVLLLHGVCDKIRGGGSAHQRGIGCLLTGQELFPGNQQGGSGNPVGWASGISVDQEICNFLQADPETRTRFGSLVFGVNVPDRADVWTRLSYTGPNRPITPITDPYQMFAKLYGEPSSQEDLKSILDSVREDLSKLARAVSGEDRRLLDEHATFVREMERELRAAHTVAAEDVPRIEPGVDADDVPRISRMQIDLMVSSFAADFARLATLQFDTATGQAKLHWLGINDAHHEISHEPDSNADAQDKLIRINRWYCDQMAYLVRRLAETPEPGGDGSLLDNTLVIWSNELGKGNSHTLNNIPFVLAGGGLDFRLGRSIQYPMVPHNRLLLSIAHGFGHYIDRFGIPEHCVDGPLPGLT
jgi:hypothetical protein